MTARPTLIVGTGYLGQRVACRLLERGNPVAGTTRSQQKAEHLADLGVEPILLDVTQPNSCSRLPLASQILYCVGFDRSSGKSIAQVYVDGLQNILDVVADSQPDCPIVYASSTGVYGGNDGDWVDELTPPEPETESGRACLQAEERLVAHAERCQSQATILRFAGLYGPNRIMRQESLKRGEPVVGRPDKYLNFIQIDDAATMTVEALTESKSVGIERFLISDGHPLVRSEFYGLVAELLGVAAPQFETPTVGSSEAKREESNKRIRNRKMLDRWGNHLRFPEIRAGLIASLGQNP